ncbi:peptidylprolyl isomerase [bacterium]
MKKIVVLLMLFLIAFIVCGKKGEIVMLEKDSPGYILGKQIAPKLPMMDPDSNQVLATTKTFQVSAGEALQTINLAMGNQTANFANANEQQLKDFLRRFLNQHVEKKVLLEAAGKARTRVTSTEVDSVLNVQYQRTGGETQFVERLTNAGVSIDYVKEDIANNLLINKYLKKIIEEKSQVSEEQIQEAYEKSLTDTTVSVRHILLLTQGKSDAEKKTIRKRMESILKQAKSGDDFEMLAKSNSEDPGSKENGGLYEDFNRGTMVKPFEDAAFSVPIGEISDIVETQYGYHILKVIDRKTNAGKPLEEMRTELEEKLKGPMSRTIIPAHITELKEEWKVEIIAI